MHTLLPLIIIIMNVNDNDTVAQVNLDAQI